MNDKLNERLLDGNQPRLMNGDGSEIRKVQSKHVELLNEILDDENIVDLKPKSIFDYNPKKNIFSI